MQKAVDMQQNMKNKKTVNMAAQYVIIIIIIIIIICYASRQHIKTYKLYIHLYSPQW